MQKFAWTQSLSFLSFKLGYSQVQEQDNPL